MIHTDFLSYVSPVGARLHWPFIKMHGLENYFVILDRRSSEKQLTTAEIIRICSSNVGAGGEQLLTIDEASSTAQAVGAYAMMRIFNTDGKEVGACGNATRCVAHLLLEEAEQEELLIETGGGLLQCRRAGPLRISVTLGPISSDWQAIPMSEPTDTLHLPIESGPLRDGLAFNIGNPHAVFFVDRLDEAEVSRFALRVQNHRLFPEGVNVGVAEVVDERTLRLAVWERPGALTRACGTGACVAAFAAVSRGLIKSRNVFVHLPAGLLDIALVDNNEAIMTGPVAFCCYGFIESGTHQELRPDQLKSKSLREECRATPLK